MKLKNYWKRFWTLDRHHAEGFTLVELIVVIAILAILAGVGIPVYSGYITKANKQADITLAGEIENALVLAHYNGTLPDGASVVVYYDESKNVATPIVYDSNGNELGNAAAAMIAAFGDNYTSLRLKYDGWDSGVAANSEMMQFVENSCFKGDNLNELLVPVQSVVDALCTYLDTGNVSINPNEPLGQYLTNLGVDTTDPRATANATTMFVGNVFANKVNDTLANGDSETADDYYSNEDYFYSWVGCEFSDVPKHAEWAAEYASALGLAKYIDGKTGGTTSYTARLEKIATESGTLINIHTQEVYEEMMAEPSFESYFIPTDSNSNESTQAYQDAMAFLAYMDGVDSSANALVSDTDMSKENYYNDGYILNYITDYISIGDALSAAGISSGKGVIAFVCNDGNVGSTLDYIK